jgi:hypothetical protein
MLCSGNWEKAMHILWTLSIFQNTRFKKLKIIDTIYDKLFSFMVAVLASFKYFCLTVSNHNLNQFTERPILVRLYISWHPDFHRGIRRDIHFAVSPPCSASRINLRHTISSCDANLNVRCKFSYFPLLHSFHSFPFWFFLSWKSRVENVVDVEQKIVVYGDKTTVAGG